MPEKLSVLATCQAENHDSVSIQRLDYRLDNRGNVIRFSGREDGKVPPPPFSIRPDRLWNPLWVILSTTVSLYQEGDNWPSIAEGKSGWSHNTSTAICIHGNSSFGCFVVFVAQLSVTVWRTHNKPQREQTASDCKNGEKKKTGSCLHLSTVTCKNINSLRTFDPL
jgi:hypothetical protein